MPLRRLFAFVFCAIAGSIMIRADDATDEIVRIHIAAIGGQAAVDRVAAFRATGHVVVDGETIPFTTIAARPNRLRMEYTFRDGTLVQATDGASPPWETDTRRHPAVNRIMGTSAAEQFMAGAEFDDPLIAGSKRGYTIENAGEATIKGRRLLRVLVTHELTQSYFVFLDPTTYFIVLRIDPPRAAGPERAEIVTEYHDFRPVGGVLVPHAVTVTANGRVTEDAQLDSIVPNPKLSPDTFIRPQL